MSCNRNSNKAGAAGVKTGISSVSSKANNNIVGAMSDRILNVVDRDGALARVARNPVRRLAGDVVISSALTLGGVVVVFGTAAITGQISVQINPDKEKGPLSTHQVGLRKKRTVEVYQDKKHPNTRVFSLSTPDLIRNWENRTRTVNVSGGKKQEYSQLVGKTVPRNHYYFKGRLSDQDAVRIAAGEQKAEDTPGYSGQVTAQEALMPTWSALKHGLIRSSLGQPNQDSQQVRKEATDPPNSALKRVLLTGAVIAAARVAAQRRFGEDRIGGLKINRKKLNEFLETSDKIIAKYSHPSRRKIIQGDLEI